MLARTSKEYKKKKKNYTLPIIIGIVFLLISLLGWSIYSLLREDEQAINVNETVSSLLDRFYIDYNAMDVNATYFEFFDDNDLSYDSISGIDKSALIMLVIDEYKSIEIHSFDFDLKNLVFNVLPTQSQVDLGTMVECQIDGVYTLVNTSKLDTIKILQEHVFTIHVSNSTSKIVKLERNFISCLSENSTCNTKSKGKGKIDKNCNCVLSSKIPIIPVVPDEVIPDVSGVVEMTPPLNLFECDNWNKNIGDECDDGIDTTVNDKIDSNCNCKGDANCTIGTTCSDGNLRTKNDKIINANCDCQGNYDCPSLKSNIGEPCPNDPSKSVNYNCSCIKQTSQIDSDGDGISDNEDKCPNRSGNMSSDGCPAINAIAPLSIFIGESVTLSKISFPLLNSDIIEWIGSSGIKVLGDNSPTPIIEGKVAGKQNLSLTIKGTVDLLYRSTATTVCVQATNKKLNSLLKPIVDYGAYEIGNAIPPNIQKAFDQSLLVLDNILDEESILYVNNAVWGGDVSNGLISQIGTPGSYVSKAKGQLEYSIDGSCVVEKIRLEVKY